MMRMVAGAIFDAVPLGEGAEFSVEIDPNEIDEARLDALAEAGMNRASIGVQDFDPDIQKVIGRDQTYEVTKRACDMIRARQDSLFDERGDACRLTAAATRPQFDSLFFHNFTS